MPITEVSICNSALIKIGQERITALDEQSKAAILCNERYPHIRDEVLEDHPWNFALVRASLSQLTDAPLFGYDYAYQKPADCLRIWKTDIDDVDYRIEGDQVLTDEDTFNCIYIKQETNPAKFSRAFAEAVAFRLAAELAYAIAQSSALQDTMMRMYEQRLRMAKSSDAQEGSPDDLIETTWDKARY